MITDYQFRMMQSDLKLIYENAKARMKAHPEIAEKHKDTIEKCRFFDTEKEALQEAIKQRKDNRWACQIWSKIEKYDDVYRITNYWLVTDDGATKLSADYIGMALMYDETRLLNIIESGVSIDEVIAYL